MSEAGDERRNVQALVRQDDPADALAVYYALYAPANTRAVFTAVDAAGVPDGFLVRARTALDLFRPIVAFRARTERAAESLIALGVPAARPVILAVPAHLGPWAYKYLQTSDAEVHRIYRLDAADHHPLVNVLATTGRDPNGGPRCEIRSGDQLGAVAGVNWQTSHFAEVYVYTDPAVRGRGWGKSVVSTVAGLVLATGRIPLYVVAENNDYSIRLAEAVGFHDTGGREILAEAVRPAESAPTIG
ncbi:MAG TPA: GNAT family N-acetyltransferase [Anaerolineales bacterium]|nr:GNAT family N-acetyltransferase [Anaerolineales bacterium]